MRDYLAPHIVMLEQLARRADEFDIIHLHVDYLGYPILRRLGVPYLTTLHGRLDLPELQPLYDIFDDVPVVSISDSQREPLPQANYIATVHHGLPEQLLLPGSGAGGYLAFLGRISPEKAPDAAIRIAAAGRHEAQDRRQGRQGRPGLFRSSRSSRCSPSRMSSSSARSATTQKSEFLGNAAGLLFPIAWREPFGLVMIEAMACGTPVIALRNGSVPEVIEDGVTGFIVETRTGRGGGAAACTRLDRAASAASSSERFTARRMAEDYLAHLSRG